MARDRTGHLAGGFFPNSCFTCMGAHFWTIMAPNFQTPFSVGPRVTFDPLLGGPGVAFGCLVGTSWILWGVLGVLVRLFWVMGAHFRRIMAPNPETFPGTLSGRSQGHFWFTFGLLLDGPGVTFGCLMGPLGSFGVCLASSCDSFG